MKSGHNVFLTGKAGSGKTYVLNEYIRRLRDCDVPVAITASTGIAATHIGGVTIHSWSGVGIQQDMSDEAIDAVASKQRVVKQIQDTKVLIIDEISMLSAQMLDNIERIIQAVTYDSRPWGGMQVIFCGDFFQLPPITRGRDSTKRFAFAARAWNGGDIHFCYLDSQHRQTDNAFVDILDALRVGKVTDEIIALLEERKNATLSHMTPVRLFTHNVDVDRVNQQHLDALPGEPRTYTAGKKGNKKMLQSLLKGLLTPEVLSLKVDAHVLFVKNNPAMGYRNGTTGVVVGFDEKTNYPIVRTADDPHMIVEPETWSIENEDELLASVVQIPLKLARAITIHKSQGMTLDAAEIDLSKSFAYGQAYVALSRVKDLSGLSLLGLNRQGLQAHPLVIRGDAYFHKQSLMLANKYADHTAGQRQIIHEQFVTTMGGVYRSPEQLKKIQRRPKQLREKKKKGETVLLTAELVKEGKDIGNICEARGLTRTTVIKHIRKIATAYPDISLAYLRPDEKILGRVQGVVDDLIGDDSNYTESGELRLSTIYQKLNGSLSYDDLKLCMVFVEQE